MSKHLLNRHLFAFVVLFAFGLTSCRRDSTTLVETDSTKTSAVIPFDGLFVTNNSDTLNGTIAISGDGKKIARAAFGTGNWYIYIFDVTTGAVSRKIQTFFPDYLQFNYNGTRILAGGGSAQLTVFNALNGSIIHEFPGFNYGYLSTTGDSVLLRTVDNQNNVIFFGMVSTTAGDVFSTYKIPATAWPMAFSSNSRSIVMNELNSRKMWVIDATTGDTKSTYNTVVDIYGSVASPDARIIAGFSRTTSNAFEVYDSETGEKLPSTAINANTSIALSNDHKTVAVSRFSSGTTAQNTVEEIATGTIVKTLPGITSPYPWVRDFAISDNGSILAGAYWNSSKVWKIK